MKTKTMVFKDVTLEVSRHEGRNCWVACWTRANRGRWLFAHTRMGLFFAIRKQLETFNFEEMPVESWAETYIRGDLDGRL